MWHRSFQGFNFVRESGLWLSDTTAANSTSSRHGLLPKLSGDTGTFLRGDGSWAGATIGGGLPYMYPFADVLDDAINDNFRTGDGAGGMDTSGTRFSGAGAWTSENIGSSTINVGNGRFWLTSPASASIQIRGYYQAVPSGNWCIRAAVVGRPISTDTTEKAVGMYLRESATGKIEWWAIGYSGGNPIYWAGKLTNATTYSATRQTFSASIWPPFLEIEYDGTNYYFRSGWRDGPLYRLHTGFSFAKANFFTTAADGIGLFSENDQSVANTLICSGFYRVPTSSVL